SDEAFVLICLMSRDQRVNPMLEVGPVRFLGVSRVYADRFLHNLSMRSRRYRGMLIIIFGIAVTLTVAGCASSAEPSSPTAFPTDIRDNFLVACEAQPGASASMCLRCLKSVQDSYTLDEFVELE